MKRLGIRVLFLGAALAVGASAEAAELLNCTIIDRSTGEYRCFLAGRGYEPYAAVTLERQSGVGNNPIFQAQVDLENPFSGD